MTGSDQLRNEFSGEAETVVQVGRNLGTININQLPAVPVRMAEVPRQVPAAQRGFVNRRAELEILDALAAQDGEPPRIIVCFGLRGLGKSATARRWVHGARKWFPGGDLYVDYGALSTRGGAAVSDAIVSCLRGVGVDDSVLPASRPELASLFRSRTAGAAVLVVLDDVTEPAQVLDLLPNSPGSVVLATSDAVLNELRKDGAWLMEIEPLDDSSALRLIADQCGDARVTVDGDAMAALLRACAGHPVALQVVASRLAADTYLTTSELVAELARGPMAGVTAVLEMAYRSLPDGAAYVYRRLGLLPGPDFTSEVANVAAGRDAAEDLAQLVARRLVERIARDRYRLHSLVRTHAIASGDVDSSAATAALHDVVAVYVLTASQADIAAMGSRMRLTPPPSSAANPFAADPGSALAWFETERANLLAIQRTAYEHGWLDMAWQLAETMTALFFNRRYLSDWAASGRLGIAAAAEEGREDAQIRLQCLTSRALTGLGRTTEAMAGLDEALALAEPHGDAALLGSVWEFRGRCLERDSLDAAADAYIRSIAFNETAGEVRGAALARFFLGSCRHRQGRSAQAVKELRIAYDVLAAMGDGRMASRVLIDLGRALSSDGERTAAARALSQAVADLCAGGWLHYEAEALEALADLREHEGDRDGARECLQRARDIHGQFQSPRTELIESRLACL